MRTDNLFTKHKLFEIFLKPQVAQAYYQMEIQSRQIKLACSNWLSYHSYEFSTNCKMSHENRFILFCLLKERNVHDISLLSLSSAFFFLCVIICFLVLLQAFKARLIIWMAFYERRFITSLSRRWTKREEESRVRN